MRWLCRIGLHEWLRLGKLLILPFCTVSECLRCHVRKADYGYATVFQAAPDGGWQDYLDLNMTMDTEPAGRKS